MRQDSQNPDTYGDDDVLTDTETRRFLHFYLGVPDPDETPDPVPGYWPWLIGLGLVGLAYGLIGILAHIIVIVGVWFLT